MTMFPDRRPVTKRSVVLVSLYFAALAALLAFAFRPVEAPKRAPPPLPALDAQADRLVQDDVEELRRTEAAEAR